MSLRLQRPAGGSNPAALRLPRPSGPRNDSVRVFVSGTIAYDVVMNFPGRFADHIDLKKIHVLSLSFMLQRVERSFGGTAGNIAYNLAMLKVPTVLIGSVGPDGKELLRRYKNITIVTKLLRRSKRPTACAYIITDRDDNQIAGFYPGAGQDKHAAQPPVEPQDLAIISAETPANMTALARYYQKKGTRYIFDPGQQVIALSPAQLRAGIRGASMVIGNDYEMGLLRPLLRTRNDMIVITTLGPKGSEILIDNRKIRIGIGRPRRVVDPTGAGDAYRAGLIKGIISGFDLKSAAQLGATAASFAVEKYGTQNHKFSYNMIVRRHNRNFDAKI